MCLPPYSCLPTCTARSTGSADARQERADCLLGRAASLSEGPCQGMSLFRVLKQMLMAPFSHSSGCFSRWWPAALHVMTVPQGAARVWQGLQDMRPPASTTSLGRGCSPGGYLHQCTQLCACAQKPLNAPNFCMTCRLSLLHEFSSSAVLKASLIGLSYFALGLSLQCSACCRHDTFFHAMIADQTPAAPHSNAGRDSVRWAGPEGQQKRWAAPPPCDQRRTIPALQHSQCGQPR